MEGDLCQCLHGTETNTVLAKELGVSLPTVKKMWLSIYDRVAQHAPELIVANATIGAENKRGKEKKRHLLAYLQEHPEELRPVVRRAAGQKPRHAVTSRDSGVSR